MDDLCLGDVPVERLKNMAELAKEFGVARGAVWNWQQRYESFPAPVWRNYWDVEDVREWRKGIK